MRTPVCLLLLLFPLQIDAAETVPFSPREYWDIGQALATSSIAIGRGYAPAKQVRDRVLQYAADGGLVFPAPPAGSGNRNEATLSNVRYILNVAPVALKGRTSQSDLAIFLLATKLPVMETLFEPDSKWSDSAPHVEELARIAGFPAGMFAPLVHRIRERHSREEVAAAVRDVSRAAESYLSSAPRRLLFVKAVYTSESSSAAAADETAAEQQLKALMTRLGSAMARGDKATVLAITRGLLPDRARMAKAFRDNVPAETLSKVESYFKTRIPTDEAQLALVFAVPADRTEVQVHSATTEELAAYTTGGPAYMHFAGASKEIAPLLRPGMTFYKVDFIAPGQRNGTAFQLLFHDGRQWTFLGRVWQMVR